MSENEELELSAAQRVAGNIVAGSLIVLCGVFLLLSGVGVIGLELKKVALPACLFAVGLSLLITSLMHRNCVSLWLSFAFNVPAAVSLTAAYTALSYANLYPFYIAIPAIASLFTMIMTPHAWLSHLKVTLFFGIIALLFLLNSVWGVSWGIVLPLLLVLGGLLIIYAAVAAKLWGKSTEE